MHNRKSLIGTLSSLLTLTILYILVIFGFSLRLKIPTNLQFIMPISIFILFIVFVLLTIWTVTKLTWPIKIKHYVGYAVIVFLIGNNIILDRVSFCNRKSETQNYLLTNETKIKNLIDYYKGNGEDIKFSVMLKEMNINYFWYNDNEYHLGLYNFFGYGYRIIFTEKANLTYPHSPGGSPTVQWFKIKDHWYYYSYWD
jgi:hypothetical protein